MKERILFVGVGQCGSNIAYEFQRKGYLAQYINTSQADLDTIDSKFKYHIPGGFGCAKNQKKAAEYAKDNYPNMINLIDRQFTYQDNIFFVCSAGGGSGSTIAPILLKMLARRNPKKTYGMIAAMPSLSESSKSLRNALVTYKKILNLERVGNVYLLDNNTRDNKFEINQIFANKFDEIENITRSDSRGIIDEEEISIIRKVSGNAVIEEIESLNYTYDNFKKSIFLSCEKGCKYLAYSTKDIVNPNALNSKFGKPTVDSFYGYNNEKNIVMAAGLPYPKEHIQKYLDSIESKKLMINSDKTNIHYEIPDLVNEDIHIVVHEKEDTYDDIFDEYL